MKTLITDSQSLVKVTNQFGRELPIYDDGYGPLFIHRDSMGISGIVRAQTWEDAYAICEDEFFPEASETIEEMIAEYGEDFANDGSWQETYGFRPNGPNASDKLKHGIYAKDLNGDSLEILTPELAQELELTVEVSEQD